MKFWKTDIGKFAFVAFCLILIEILLKARNSEIGNLSTILKDSLGIFLKLAVIYLIYSLLAGKHKK